MRKALFYVCSIYDLHAKSDDRIDDLEFSIKRTLNAMKQGEFV